MPINDSSKPETQAERAELHTDAPTENASYAERKRQSKLDGSYRVDGERKLHPAAYGCLGLGLVGAILGILLGKEKT